MVKLTCKSCGAKLELTDDIDRFSCTHCGSEWLVNRGGGIVSLKAIEDDINTIKETTKEIVEEIKGAKDPSNVYQEEVIRQRARSDVEMGERVEAAGQLFGCAKWYAIIMLVFLAPLLFLIGQVALTAVYKNTSDYPVIGMLLTIAFVGIGLGVFVLVIKKLFPNFFRYASTYTKPAMTDNSIIQFRCPKCEALLRMPSGHDGAETSCPKCNQSITVPSPG